jgi:hypothetical protein
VVKGLSLDGGGGGGRGDDGERDNRLEQHDFFWMGGRVKDRLWIQSEG